MKKIVYLIVCMCTVWCYSCSYSDLSSNAGNPIPDLIIDTTGVPYPLVTKLGEQLVVEPKVSSASNPERDFSYEWRISNVPNASTTLMDLNLTVVGREEKLNYTVVLPPDATTYQLWYIVVDNKSGLVANKMWRLLVEMDATQGLLVAHSDDGVTTELSLLQDTLFTAAFRGTTDKAPDPTKINHIFSTIHGAKYNGIVKEMLFRLRYHDGRLLNCLEAHSGDNIFRLNLLTYTKLEEGQNMFLDTKPVVLDIKALFLGSNAMLNAYPAYNYPCNIWNNRGFYKSVGPTATGSMSLSGYGAPSVGSPPDALAYGRAPEYDPDPILSKSYNSNSIMFYDRLYGRFLILDSYMWNDRNTRPTETTHSDGLPFDSRNVGALDILAAGSGNNSDCRFVVKQNGVYRILSMNQNNGSARAIIEINNAPNIAKATHFAICINQPVVYYATSDNEIYSIHFVDGLGNIVTYSKVWTSSDPINGLYFTRQCDAARPIRYHGTALVATTTANQSEGKVWVLPFVFQAGSTTVIAGTGEIDNSKIVSFSGFGRISTITMVE